MRRLGADMAGDAVVERAGRRFREACGGGAADEPVEDHRDPLDPRPRDGAGHGRDLAPAQRLQDVQTVAPTPVPFHAPCDHLRLEVQPRVVDPRPAPGPVGRRAAIERMGDGRGRGGVADPHLARHQQVRRRIDGRPAGRKRLDEPGIVHRGRFGEIRGRAIQRQRVHVHPRPGQLRQLVDRGPAVAEVRDHLHRHLGRKGRHATGRHAVVSGKDDDLRAFDPRRGLAPPGGIPDRQILEPAQGTRRLGQLAVAVGGGGAGLVRGCGGGGQRVTQVGRGSGGGHAVSVALGSRPVSNGCRMKDNRE